MAQANFALKCCGFSPQSLKLDDGGSFSFLTVVERMGGPACCLETMAFFSRNEEVVFLFDHPGRRYAMERRTVTKGIRTMSTRNGRISIIWLFYRFHKSFWVCNSFAPLYRIRGITGLKRWFRIRTLISVLIEFLPHVCFKASWPSFLINYLMGRSVNHQTYQS